jgi:hypothetical protein
MPGEMRIRQKDLIAMAHLVQELQQIRTQVGRNTLEHCSILISRTNRKPRKLQRIVLIRD